jgi:hypothetical protein
MLPYLYITVALLCSPINHNEFTPLINSMYVCVSEEYRVCFIPDHCIYFEKYYDTTIKEFTTINPKLYYDLVTNQYITSSLNNNHVVTSNHPLVKYYNKLEVSSYSVPLYNTSYIYNKELKHDANIVNINEWLYFLM